VIFAFRNLLVSILVPSSRVSGTCSSKWQPVGVKMMLCLNGIERILAQTDGFAFEPILGRSRSASLTSKVGSSDWRGGMAKTVLIVEDNELNMKLFRDLLEAQWLPDLRYQQRFRGA